jgi:hypothetical protein
MTFTQTVQIGDAVLANTKGAYGRLIQFGQAIRWKKHRQWHHSAIVVRIDPSGQIWCVQMARRGELVKIENIAPGRPLKIVPCPEHVDRDRAVAYAMTLVGIKYGILTIISIAFNILTPQPIRIDLRRDETLICSAAVARSWEHGGWYCPGDPFQISPAQIDEYVGARGWIFHG